MIRKNKDFKLSQNTKYKVTFNILLLIYITGLCTGCVFTLKNAYNLDFVKYITLTENISKQAREVDLAVIAPYILRDIVICTLIPFLKYSGIQKSLIICVPFILSVQNGCIYSILFYEKNINIFNIMFNYVLKDTAITIILLLFIFTTVKEILSKKYNIKKDIKKLFVYYISISCVYIIYYLIKRFIYTGI